MKRCLWLLLAIVPIPAFAWTDTGHMIVARIAEGRLKPAVKAKLQKLNAIGADDYTNSIAAWACYADDHKSKDDREWHYKDIHFRADGKPSKNFAAKENLVTAMNTLTATLGSPKATQKDKARAAGFILHLVGDAHQPLHALARDTDAYPNGDRGGNDFRIADIRGWSDRPVRNLHLAWDFGLGEFLDIERPLSAEGFKQLDAHVAKITKENPASKLSGLTNLDPEAWIKESASYRDIVYGTPENGPLSQEYIRKGRELCRKRLAIAGYRLANLLNKLLS